MVEPDETLDCTAPGCDATFTLEETPQNSGICPDCGMVHMKIKNAEEQDNEDEAEPAKKLDNDASETEPESVGSGVTENEGEQQAEADGSPAAPAPEATTGAEESAKDATSEQKPESVALTVGDYEFTKQLGEPVGKEVRRGVINSGRDPDIARRVHREHIKFISYKGDLLVEVLGKLGILVNGTRYEKGDSTQIKSGDTITFNPEYDISADVEVKRV